MARVLVVDDDPRLVKVVANLLRKHEFQVESVPNGELGRQALRRGDIDLALLDVNLPDVNGLSLIFQLREEGNTTPIILLTVRTEVHEQALGLRLGGDDYIVKPFNPEVLLARIDAVLRRSAPSTPSRTETPATSTWRSRRSRSTSPPGWRTRTACRCGSPPWSTPSWSSWRSTAEGRSPRRSSC
ncbi:response regulator transcription factor [Actinomadura madurae]|uniref:response regulator transcription factor n=1 Tax=Actinomadura madurae TaxID=1993 RepID=UPI0020D2194C|nr:response regulator transcription factor [Actinomadura madurae]MCP9968494.1 response regulator transcription factor [Actinomadura madurae]